MADARRGMPGPLSDDRLDGPVGFGKHRTETWNEVIVRDPSYAAFAVASMDRLDTDLREQIERGLEDTYASVLEWPVGFGKHSKLTWEEVIDADPGWTWWAVDEVERLGDELRTEVREALIEAGHENPMEDYNDRVTREW